MCDCTNDPYTASCGTHFWKKNHAVYINHYSRRKCATTKMLRKAISKTQMNGTRNPRSHLLVPTIHSFVM